MTGPGHRLARGVRSFRSSATPSPPHSRLISLEMSPHTAKQITGPGQRLTPGRVDLRMAMGPEGRVFLLNEHDGTLRAIVP